MAKRPVQKSKRGKTRTRTQRTANMMLKAKKLEKKFFNLVSCKNCSSWVLPHTICDICGWYKNKHILEIKQKTSKKDMARKEAEEVNV